MTPDAEQARKEELNQQAVQLAQEESSPASVDTAEKIFDAKAQETSITSIDKSYFKKNARVGLEEVDQTDLPTPTLVLIQPNSRLTDSEGNPYKRGYFFYQGNSTLFSEVECTFLALTKKQFPDYSDKTIMVPTYVLLGVFPDNKPFILYLKKTGIGAAKQFLGKVTSSGYPMYCVKVKLTSDFKEGDRGDYFKIVFNVEGYHEDPKTILKLEKLAKRYGPHIRSDEDGEAEDVTPNTQENQEEVEDLDDLPF